MNCEYCGKQLDPAKQAKNNTRFCSKRCGGQMTRKYQSGGRCAAPVPGGCDRLHEAGRPLCIGHQRRVQRGDRIDTALRAYTK